MFDSLEEYETPPRTPPPQRETITLTSINVGGPIHVMTADGRPQPEFTRFMKTMVEPYFLFLHDLQLTNKCQRWKTFKTGLHHTFPRAIAPRLHGKRGTAVIHSPLPFPHSFDACVSENAITIQLHTGKDHRCIVHGVYFPFALANIGEITSTLERIEEYSRIPGNTQVVIGDLNPGKKPAWAWQTVFQRSGLHKIELGKTGFKAHTLEAEGEAQGLWTSDVTTIKLPQHPVISGFERLSNCHRPITAEVLIQDVASKPVIKRPNIRAECRVVGRMGSKLAAAAEKATTFEEIKLACMEFTRPPPHKPHILAQQRQRKKRNWKPETSHSMLMKMALRTRNDARKKKIRKLAIVNPAAIARMFLGLDPPAIEAENPNIDYAAALSALSWMEKECGNIEDHLPESIRNELKSLANSMKAPLTAADLIESAKKIRRNTTYPDLPAQVALLLGPNAIGIIADYFTKRLTDPLASNDITMIGIPTGKKLRPTDTGIFKILQRGLRPIGLIDLFNAWFNITVQIRLSRIASTIAAPNMFAYLKGREGHDLIFQTMLRVEDANRRKRVLWIIKADAVKAFDRMQFLAIARLDAVTGATGIFSAMAQTFSNVRLHIRIHQGPPCTVTPKSGGVQGDARNPPIWVALTANMAHAVDEDARKLDATFTRESASFFADDGIFTSGRLELALNRFKIAQQHMGGQGQELEIISIARNEHVTAFDQDVKTVTYDGITHKVQRSLCILQACIHLTPGSDCAKRKCKRCTLECIRTYCQPCETAVAANIQAIDLSIIDQAEILNTHVTSAIMYGNYSCSEQREWGHKFQESIRGPLHGASYGGYVEWAHLPTELGGIGVIDVKRQSAVNILEIIDRITARPGRTQDLAITILSGLHNSWPKPIMDTLNADPNFSPQIQPHWKITHSDLSQRPNVHIWYVLTQERKDGERGTETWIVIHSSGIDTNGNMKTCSRSTKNLTNNTKGITNAQIRLLATAIEVHSEQKNTATIMTPFPDEVKKRLVEYMTTPLPHKFQNRVYIDILRRTKISEDPVLANKTVFAEIITLHETRHPAAFPFTITLQNHNFGLPYFAEHAAAETKRQLKLLQLREAITRRQAADVLGTLPQTDHALSAITSTARVGSHHFSTLLTSQVNALARWRSAAVIKTNCLGTCRFETTNGICNGPADTAHIVSHISVKEIRDTINKCEEALYKTDGKLHRILEPSNIPLAMWLGYVTTETVTWAHPISDPKQAKAHKQQSQKVSTIFAKKGLETMMLCLPTHPLAPPPTQHETLWARNDHSTPTEKHQHTITGESDASGPIPETGACGIAGIILDQRGQIIYSFQAFIELPPHTSSTVAEYLGQLMLLCATCRLQLHKQSNIALYRCYRCDNMAVVEQLEGQWHANAECRAVRILVQKLEAIIGEFNREWIPRAQNTRSDAMAGEARIKRITRMHHKDREVLTNAVKHIWDLYKK